MDADDQPLGASTDLVVIRTPAGWSVAPARQRDVIDVDSELLQELVSSTGGRPLSARGPVVDALRNAGVVGLVGGNPEPRPPASLPSTGLPAASWIEPLNVFVARGRGGVLTAEGVNGEELVIDDVDVRLLDAVTGPVRVGDLTARLGQWLRRPSRREISRRAARLAAAGRLRALDGPPSDPGGDPDRAAEARDEAAAAALATDRFRTQEFDEHETVEYVGQACPTDPPPGAVPVYSVWQLETGPALSLGMLTASARAHAGGVLQSCYEIRRPEDPAAVLADLRDRSGPAVLLLSNYVWCLDHNLAVARRAKELCPDLLVIHGGPSTPKYEVDCERFLTEHEDIAHVAVRGEGEVTLAEALLALAPTFPDVDLSALDGVAGLTYRHPDTGRFVRTADRERVATLDQLPSPYLTGEFDHLAPSAWRHPGGLSALVLETNRGCPYGCTFCDWGSSTLSRVRKFDLDRITAEMRWAAERGFGGWMLADANFGILSRDVEVTERLAALKAEFEVPGSLGFNVAKNTTKHLTAIVDRLVAAGVSPHFTLALQTRDDGTLEAVSRTNISSDHYVSLAASFRRGGLPLLADLMVGLPGQTVGSFADDLQFLIEHEIPARMWITKLLPNAPMNDPQYRQEHDIVADDQQIVVATSTFSTEDRRTMMLLRHAYVAFEQFGLLRHVGRHLMWDHGLGTMTVIRRIVEVSEAEPERYPLLNWVMRYFDYFNAPPVGWRSFFAEFRTFLHDEFGIEATDALDVAITVTHALLPEEGRTFPVTVPVAHDYVAYHRDRTAHLWSGPAGAHRRLEDYGPGAVTVYGDPLDQCRRGVRVNGDPRNEFMQERYWLEGHWELDSPLVVNYPTVAGAGAFVGLPEQIAAAPAPVDDTPSSDVRLQRRRLVGSVSDSPMVLGIE